MRLRLGFEIMDMTLVVDVSEIFYGRGWVLMSIV